MGGRGSAKAGFKVESHEDLALSSDAAKQAELHANAGAHAAAVDYKALGISATELQALTTYTGSAYGEINAHALALSTGKTTLGNDLKNDRRVLLIDKALSKSVLDKAVTVYRGYAVKSLSAAVDGNKAVGMTIKSPAFSSSSRESKTAGQFSHGEVTAKIVLPKGYKGALPVEKISKYAHEKEYLIKRDAEFKIIKSEHVPIVGSKTGAFYRLVTMVPV